MRTLHLALALASSVIGLSCSTGEGEKRFILLLNSTNTPNVTVEVDDGSAPPRFVALKSDPGATTTVDVNLGKGEGQAMQFSGKVGNGSYGVVTTCSVGVELAAVGGTAEVLFSTSGTVVTATCENGWRP